MESTEASGYFLGLVDGILASKELWRRTKGTAESVEDFKCDILKEADLLLSNLTKRRAEAVLEEFGDY